VKHRHFTHNRQSCRALRALSARLELSINGLRGRLAEVTWLRTNLLFPMASIRKLTCATAISLRSNRRHPSLPWNQSRSSLDLVSLVFSNPAHLVYASRAMQ
jgi:hypothetical protein